MKPVGPLMVEHRLIERMIRALGRELTQIRESGDFDPVMVDTAVDFIRTYADRTHHGKEELILFRDLEARPLTDEHRRVMAELLQEHDQAREMVGSLVAAKERYQQHDPDALPEVAAIMEQLIHFYPIHIEKEDKQFFLPCMDYFTREELDAMLEEFREFDRTMIHEKYLKVVERFEASP